MNVKMICFDMDGTIADLYGVNGWLEMLRDYNPAPYVEAKPMWDMAELANTLMALQEIGIEIRIITWLAKETTEDYKNEVRDAKRAWLEEYAFPFDHFHGVAYGATKADSVRKYLAEDESAILFDDNAKVREGWHLGEAVDPTAIDIVEYLKGLLNQ
jgi:phosphoglycolate phosphatase-like HAD superfamily hydrolase